MSKLTPIFPENITEYAPWVAKHGLRAPYGKCQCGCGQDTRIAKWREREWGIIGGHPIRFVHGHQQERNLEERFWAKVDKKSNDECWLWTASVVGGTEYGNIAWGGRRQLAHRVSWQIHFGPIPKGAKVCHNCPGGDNARCVNPAHLFLATQGENVRDMYSKGRNPNRDGELNGRHKITEEMVREIRKRYAQGELQRVLAKEFGLGQSQISLIICGGTWKHVR